MSDATTDAGADMSAHGNGSDNPNGSAAANSADFDAKLNRAITGHIARLEKKFAAMMASAVNSELDRLAQAPVSEAAAAPQAASDNASGERPTLKALEGKLTQLQQQLQSEQKARQDAEQRALDARTRADVQAQFAKVLGAENPLLGHLMESYYDVRKRFARGEDGSTAVKFKRDWGEELLPLEAGFKELMDQELKHLIPAKTAKLPPAGFPGLPGQPVAQRPAPVNGQQTPRNPFAEVLANQLHAHGDTAMAQGLMEAVARQNPPSK